MLTKRNTGNKIYKVRCLIVICTLTICLLPVFLSAQGEFNKWYFGWKAAIDFNTAPPSALLNSILIANNATVSLSDSSGNLLFYSQGWQVYNRNHQMMPNGFMLNAGLGTCQPVFAVKKPGEDSVYYLFTLKSEGSPIQLGLYYSLIDMRLSGGLGDVVPGYKNVPVTGAEDAHGMIHATRHKNNRDVWIVVWKINSNQYAAYLITSAGISPAPVLSSCNYPVGGDYSLEMKISQDGTKLIAGGSYPAPWGWRIAEVCNFNSLTGEITPLFHFRPIIDNTPVNPSYLEFSPNSKLLYVLVNTPQYGNLVFQYDLAITDSSQFVQSQLLVGSHIGGLELQLGPDGKIYQSVADRDSLNVIHFPNIRGIGCAFQKNSIFLNGRNASFGLPQFLQRYKAYIHHLGECQNSSISFSGDIWPPADSIRWNFGDAASGTANFSTLANPVHVYALPGNYTVELYVRHNDNRTDTSWQTITILEKPQPDLGADQSVCIGASVTFDAGACAGCSYLWRVLPTGTQVGTAQTFTTGLPGVYEVAVTATNNCTGTDTVQLSVSPPPLVTNNPLFKTICTGESTGILLSSSVANTMFHWTASLTSGAVSGFTPDSGLVINQTLVNAGATPGVVTYHITPKVGSCVGTPVDFPVTVNVGEAVNVTIATPFTVVCASTPVTFTASPTNPGTNPTYQWRVNGLNTGGNSPLFTCVPLNGDVVSCVLTSSNTVCTSNNPATSNSIAMTVNPNLPVSVSVMASSNPVCTGASVLFTAGAVNGGVSPQFQWLRNGIPVGAGSPAFSFIPSNGDQISCVLTSSEACTSGNPATSAPVLMTVNPNLPVSVSVMASSNPVCAGVSVLFTAGAVNGGVSPQYQWKLNGVDAGTNASAFSVIPLQGDSVSCLVTSSIACPLQNPVYSNRVVMQVSAPPAVSFIPCFDTVTTVNAKPFKLKGGLPLGGSYSGPGVNSITGVFSPSTAGTGLKTILYTYSNVSLCSASKSKTIRLQDNPAFNCGNNLTDIRDNKIYPTVQIGSQCWMAANLGFGNTISDLVSQTDNCIPEKYQQPASGSLPPAAVYQWDELMRYEDVPASQGLCPPAWHVPTQSDWTVLFNHYLGSSLAGKPLQDTLMDGFSAITTGVYYLSASWNFNGFATFFWSSTSSGSSRARAHGMNSIDPSVALYPASKANAFSARCVKD